MQSRNAEPIKITKLIMVIFSIIISQFTLATSVEDIKGFTLKNGMEFLILEDHSIPNANMYLFWKVGSRNEAPGITGLSHFFEHMMFNGAKKYGPKEFDRIMESHGGGNNAYTSENITAYTNWFPARAIEKIFELEADRIGNLVIDEKMLESERNVVVSERITGLENSNFRILHEEVKGSAFRAHPYGWSVIGHDSDIKNWRKADLEDYFSTYYAPNNALVVMVGDVELESIKSLAKKYFSNIPANDAPREVHTIEPEQKGERRVFVNKASAKAQAILIGYKVPESSHIDTFPLDVLGTLLAEGASSRLHRKLVDELELATDLFFYSPMSFDPNLFYLYVEARTGVSIEEIEKVIYQEIENISNGNIEESELDKIKNIKTMDFYHQMETINEKADTIGAYQLFFGGYEKLFQTPETYGAITKADVARVAKKYLNRRSRTVGVLGNEENKDLPVEEVIDSLKTSLKETTTDGERI
ncbi:MAG: zinc protease [Candidatus Azotimanducaceae bacterium]|jgi:zinc protease